MRVFYPESYIKFALNSYSHKEETPIYLPRFLQIQKDYILMVRTCSNIYLFIEV